MAGANRWLGALLAFTTAATLTGRADAFDSYELNCTTPPTSVNYVFEPAVRGTMGIVWNCLSVLVLCIWSVQHLSVPIRVHLEHPTWNRAVFEKARFTLDKIKWMLLTILGPEYLLGKAIAEHLAAHHSQRQIRRREWTPTHGYFANMRGFVLRFEIAAVQTPLKTTTATAQGQKVTRLRVDGDPPYEEQDAEESKRIEREHCRQYCGKHCRYSVGTRGHASAPRPTSRFAPFARAETGETRPFDPRVTEKEPAEGYRAPTRDGQTTDSRPSDEPPSSKAGRGEDSSKLGPHPTWTGTWALSASQIDYAYRNDILTELPQITAEDLSDRSKGDALVKGLAVLQITWLVIQVVARAVQNLAISLLEVTVLAFASCAILTYLVLWHKPQDVRTPVYIDLPRVLTREEIIGLAARSPVSTLVVHEFWLHGVAIRAMADNIFPSSPGIPVKTPWMKTPFYLNPVPIGIGLGGTLFGTIHFAAWNFDFPTRVEQLLWRISCCFLVTLPPFGTVAYWSAQHLARAWGMSETRINRFLKPTAYMFVPMYALARLYFLVEVFRQLAYLPPSAFQEVEWPSVIPHVGV